MAILEKEAVANLDRSASSISKRSKQAHSGQDFLHKKIDESPPTPPSSHSENIRLSPSCCICKNIRKTLKNKKRDSLKSVDETEGDF